MKIVAIANDGIGPEIMAASLPVLRWLNADLGLGLEIVERDGGFAALEAEGATVPDALLEECRTAAGIVLGPVGSFEYPKDHPGAVNPSMKFRKALDLYANIRPSRTRANVTSVIPEMDLVICRQNTEGFYPDRNMFQGSGEFMPTEDVALSVRKITRQECLRIAIVAFDLAAVRRKKVTAVHKANVMKMTDGLFLDCVRQVGRDYPDIDLEELIIDAATAHLVRRAAEFDVIVTTNMYGDILSDLAAELSGSLGLAGSINFGDDHVVAQAQHGSAPDIAGKNVANPASLMLSIAMMLAELSLRTGCQDLAEAAGRLDKAIEATLADASLHTHDLGGRTSTDEFGQAVLTACQET